MLNLEFYPYCDKLELVEAAKEYIQIWEKDGKKIVETIEKVAGQKFKFKIIRVIVYEGTCHSYPLRLRASLAENDKKAAIIHEIIHINLSDQTNELLKKKKVQDPHQFTNLILYDIWLDLYGKSFADEQVERESKFTNKFYNYKFSWDWALSLNKEERAKKFRELVEV